MKYSIWVAGIFWILGFSNAAGQETGEEPTALTAAEIIERSQRAFYYQGDDMKVKIFMQLIDKGGGARTRVMTMLRKNHSDGRKQKYFIYFYEPGDVRRMTFMVWKYPEKEDDRWIFVPAVDLIRRIAADDRRSSFVGSDFTYEDVSGRDITLDTHSLLRTDTLGSQPSYVIESIPKEPTDYTKRVSWVDESSFLPLREEYYDVQGQLSRVFTADEVESVFVDVAPDTTGYPTIMKRTMTNVRSGHRTEVTYTSVSYNIGLKDEDFSERRMRRPPRAWIE